MMKSHTSTERKAFTLAELATVGALITVLVAMMTPALTRAREDARVARCLTNVREIARGASSYVDEQGTLVFCWPVNYVVAREQSQRQFTYYTEFIWGGGVSDKRPADWDESVAGNNSPFVGNDADVLWYTPSERPLNAHLVPSVWWDNPLRRRPFPERTSIPMQLDDLFKCPTDSTAGVPDATDPPDPNSGAIMRSWEFWGTSYSINWYWVYVYTGVDGAGVLSVLGGNAAKGDPGRGSELLARVREHGASEFALFYENQMNLALQGARPRGFPESGRSLRGWHGRQDTHVAAFADGSARHQEFDTRFVDGPGWSVWPSRPWPNDDWTAYEDN